MTDSPRRKVSQPFSRATTPRTLVSACRTVALPTAALLHMLLSACGARGDVDASIRDDEPTRRKAPTASTASAPVDTATAQAPLAPKPGGAAEIEQTIALTPPPKPVAPPKALLGKPHGIKPPAKPYPLSGDMMLVVPVPVGNGIKPI